MNKKRIDYKQAYYYTLFSNISGSRNKYYILQSYSTIIAIYNSTTNEFYKNKNYYSVSTSRHYSCFLDIIGFLPDTIIEMTENGIEQFFTDLKITEVE